MMEAVKKTQHTRTKLEHKRFGSIVAEVGYIHDIKGEAIILTVRDDQGDDVFDSIYTTSVVKERKRLSTQ